MSGLDSNQELLVIYIGVSGEEQCAVVRVDDSYEEMLAEACLNLAPWLPPDWQDRRRDFAREVRNSRGDLVLAAIQPSLVVELARLGRLPELRLRTHPPQDHKPHSTQNNLQTSDEENRAYGAMAQPAAASTIGGTVHAAFHRICNKDAGQGFNGLDNSLGYPLAPDPSCLSERPMTRDIKPQFQELKDAPLASESQASFQPRDTLNSSIFNPTTTSGTTPPQSPTTASQSNNNQLPTPQSPPPRLSPWADELSRQPPPISHTQHGTSPAPLPDPVGKRTQSVERTLQASSKLVLEGKHDAAIRALRSTCNATLSPQERARLYLWLGQIGCKIKEYMNAGCDTAIARDIYAALEDRSGRIECDIVLARIAREHAGSNPQEDTKLTQLLAEAKRHGQEAVEVQLRCEICRLACSAKDNRQYFMSSVEQAKAISHRFGDTWLKAESSRTSGMLSEAGGDYISALQAYSSALELYRVANAQSPLSPIKETEANIERVKATLSKSPEKPKARFMFF